MSTQPRQRRLRAVAYLRVSTDGQAENGLGIDLQRKCIRDWAKAAPARVVSWETDEGVSGAKDAIDRPALASALAMLSDGAADALVVARLDRLARVLTVQEAVLAQAWRHGARVFTCDGGEVLQDDPDDPMRTAMRQMVGVFSQLDRAMIAARMRAGRRLKKERGGYAGGHPPLGYRAEGRELVPDAGEQEILAVIRENHHAGETAEAIAITLAERGFKTKRGKDWQPFAVSRVIRRMRQEGTLDEVDATRADDAARP